MFSFLYNKEKRQEVVVMENNHSYAEFMKRVSRNSSTMQAEQLLNDIYMERFLASVHKEQNSIRIYNLIDVALDNDNEVDFLKYSGQLKKLQELNM